MKSIKEKAEEFAHKQPLMSRKGFEAGANYVLDEIEKLIKFNRWAAQDLYELIDELKK